MKFNCLLAGVGGQGTVLASKMLAQVAIENGEFVRTSETIGMAQRGGTVVSHVRIGDRNTGPCVPKNKADLLIGFEPAEALRNIEFLKENGAILVSVDPIIPVTASLGNNEYECPHFYVLHRSPRHKFLTASNLLLLHQNYLKSDHLRNK